MRMNVAAPHMPKMQASRLLAQPPRKGSEAVIKSAASAASPPAKKS